MAGRDTGATAVPVVIVFPNKLPLEGALGVLSIGGVAAFGGAEFAKPVVMVLPNKVPLGAESATGTLSTGGAAATVKCGLAAGIGSSRTTSCGLTIWTVSAADGATGGSACTAGAAVAGLYGLTTSFGVGGALTGGAELIEGDGRVSGGSSTGGATTACGALPGGIQGERLIARGFAVGVLGCAATVGFGVMACTATVGFGVATTCGDGCFTGSATGGTIVGAVATAVGWGFGGATSATAGWLGGGDDSLTIVIRG
jgi:hypothetical protein